MKNNNRSDWEINQMIGDIKNTYGNVSKSIKNMPLFNEPSNRDGKYDTPTASNKSQRVLQAETHPDRKLNIEKTKENKNPASPVRYLVPVQKDGKSYFENVRAIKLKSGRKLRDLQLEGYSQKRLLNMDSFLDKNYTPGRFLEEQGFAPRKLAKKSSKAKKDMQIRLEILINNITDEFNGGDIKGFEKAYAKDGFVKKILDTIKCLDVKKTNRKTNADMLILVKDTENDCLDLDTKKYEPMVKYLNKKVKYPSPVDFDKKDFDVAEFLEDKVTGFLDEVSNNLDKNAKFNEKEFDKDGKDKKKKKKKAARRLNVLEPPARKLIDEGSQESSVEKPAQATEATVVDNNISLVDISQETKNDASPLNNESYYPFNNSSEKAEGQKIKLLEKTMGEKLNKLLNKGFDLKTSE